MRALINALSTVGARTGIGHYTNELLRCLAQQAAPGEITAYPHGWARQAARLWGWLRRNITRTPGPEGCPSSGRSAPNWRQHLLGQVRSHGLVLLERNFRATCRGG